jgi:hypothetical protein
VHSPSKVKALAQSEVSSRVKDCITKVGSAPEVGDGGLDIVVSGLLCGRREGLMWVVAQPESGHSANARLHHPNDSLL